MLIELPTPYSMVKNDKGVHFILVLSCCREKREGKGKDAKRANCDIMLEIKEKGRTLHGYLPDSCLGAQSSRQ